MKKIFALMMTVIASFPMTSLAKYHASSDTGTEILDYIENRRREERANRLTEEQKKLLEDIEKAKEQLPHPEQLDNEEISEDKEKGKGELPQSETSENKEIPADEKEDEENDTQKNKKKSVAPAVFEGDDLRYDVETGEFQAIGKVDIIQIDGHRFQSDEAYGNIKDQVVRVPGKAHVLQLTPDSPRITLDGYRTVYNYGTKTGTMGAARGKTGEYYISAKRFEFYPDHIVAYDATQTKCGAQRPDYHLSAEKMELWEGKVMRMYKIKFWIKDNIVAAKDYDERDITKSRENNFPRVGYNRDHGAYIEQKFEYPIIDHVKGTIDAHVETKKGIRSNTGIRYDNRNFNARVVYGYFEDSDNIWIQKEPALLLGYNRPINGLPMYYELGYEVGHWRSEDIASTHQCYSVGLGHDPINWGRYVMFLHTGYSIIKESADDSTVKGLNYDIVTAREFDDRLAAFAGYHYRKSTTKNSLFRYNNDDYAKEFETGFSYVIDEKNRAVVGWKFDAEEGSLRDVDYYWYHDLHCSQLVLRYREKRDRFEAHWQFTPW